MQRKPLIKQVSYILLCLFLLSTFTVLSGCGLDGPLYLPDKNHPEKQPDPNKPSWF